MSFGSNPYAFGTFPIQYATDRSELSMLRRLGGDGLNKPISPNLFSQIRFTLLEEIHPILIVMPSASRVKRDDRGLTYTSRNKLGVISIAKDTVLLCTSSSSDPWSDEISGNRNFWRALRPTGKLKILAVQIIKISHLIKTPSFFLHTCLNTSVRALL